MADSLTKGPFPDLHQLFRRDPSLAGGRAIRRPEHPWGHKQHGPAGLAEDVDLAATQSDRCNQTKSGGPQENLGATTHAFTVVN